MSDRRIVVLGPSSGPRLDAFKAALQRLGRHEAAFVGYHDILARPDRLEGALTPGAWLRFESPDRDPLALKALYEAGETEARSAGYPAFAGAGLAALLETKGLIGSPAQLFFGLRRILRSAARIAEAAGAELSASPEELALAYDKPACGRHLRRKGVPTPEDLGPVGGFEPLMAVLREGGRRRAFVKLRHGSAAAGMLALALGPNGRLFAYTTAELGRDGAVFATRRVRRLERHAEIASVVEALAPCGLHAEAWLPKAGIGGKVCDLRLVTIRGETVGAVLRRSAFPMTNLHLGGSRGTPEPLRRRMAPGAWERVMETVHRTSRALPSCFTLGLDVAILADLRRHAVLEVNAFGDFVKGLRHGGLTPQEHQILRCQEPRLAS